MNVLAFDTCLGAVSAAVRWRSAHGEWLLREAYEERATGHAERLFPMIAEIMDGAGLAMPAIDRFAVTAGPGTFTGVRVGVAAARALALATGKPLIAATSLAVMAHHARLLLGAVLGGRPLVVAVDARRGMVYAQRFDAEGSQAGDPKLLTPEAAARGIAHSPVLMVGSGAAAIAATMTGSPAEVEISRPDLQPRARSLALMAPDLAPVDSLKPLYLRQPDVRPQDGKSLVRAQP
jgi:tRNA threonylcarbamoyl adenosine modification protein YeaZ